MSVNKVILIGRLGKDPELTYSQSGVPVCRFSLATNEKFKDQGGVFRERTEWHNIVCFAKLAEVCGQYLSKGREAYIEGPIRTRQWEDRDGNQRASFNIVAMEVAQSPSLRLPCVRQHLQKRTTCSVTTIPQSQTSRFRVRPLLPSYLSLLRKLPWPHLGGCRAGSAHFLE